MSPIGAMPIGRQGGEPLLPILLRLTLTWAPAGAIGFIKSIISNGMPDLLRALEPVTEAQSNPIRHRGLRWLISLFRSRRVRRSLTASRVNRRVELPWDGFRRCR